MEAFVKELEAYKRRSAEEKYREKKSAFSAPCKVSGMKSGLKDYKRTGARGFMRSDDRPA